MAKGDIKYVVTADTKKGKAAIKEFDQKVDKLGKTSKTAAGGFKTLAAKVAIGVAAFYAASKALKGVIRWMGDAVDKAAIQELAEKEVAAALESTGREVLANTEHFKEYASQLQSATVFGDEQILSAQALMIQLTKLDREGLDAATKGAIGLASVYKTDLQAATTLVGKALAGNYGALSRYGIMVKRTATDEEKRVSILEQLQTMYKRAEAETDTYQGAVKQLKNTYGDLKEEMGKAITENEDVLKAINDLREGIRKFIDDGGLQELSLYFSMFIETTKKGFSVWKKIDKFLFGWSDNLKKGRDVTGELTEATKRLNEALRRAGIEKITGKEAEEGAGKAVAETTEQIETQLTVVKGIRGELTLWGQELISLTDCLKNATSGFYELGETALPAARDVSDALGLAVSSFKDATIKTEKYYSDLGETSQAFYMDVAMSAAEGFAAILSTLRQWAIAEAVKYIFAKVPFPASLIIAALAAGAIGAFFNSIKSMQTGGTIAREGIYHLHAGETVTPASNRVSNIYNQTTTGGARLYSTVNIYAQRLDDSTINQAAEKIFHAVDRQARRRGYKI